MKEQLLEALTEARHREAELISLGSGEAPDPSGRWRPQDHVVHLSWFRDRDARLIEAVRTGGEPPPKTPEGWPDALYEASRDMDADEVVSRAAESWDLYENAVKACSEEDLARSRPDNPDRKLAAGAIDHLVAHLMWCHLDAGNEPAAESSVRWGLDVASRTFPDPQYRAGRLYDLACFYARTGRAKDAIPLLRESFVDAPDLKDWAHKDTDLDQIRETPELKELLAT